MTGLNAARHRLMLSVSKTCDVVDGQVCVLRTAARLGRLDAIRMQDMQSNCQLGPATIVEAAVPNPTKAPGFVRLIISFGATSGTWADYID